MAKAPASDAVMPADRMKPLLALSKTEPVQAAIALSADGDALLLLDRKASPRKVAAMLRAGADKAKLKLAGSSLRFGRAMVDVDYDPGTVRLFINKDAPGAMRLKLTEVVKRIPYQKVEINVDPSLEDDSEDAAAPDARTAEAAAGGAAGAVAYGKARLAWLSTRQGIAADLDRLAKALRADYADEGLGNSIEDQFRAKVAPIMARFDASLADTLDDAVNETDPAKRTRLVAEARQIVGRYQAYLASETLLAVIDDNPYEPVAIVATLTRTLSALSAAVR